VPTKPPPIYMCSASRVVMTERANIGIGLKRATYRFVSFVRLPPGRSGPLHEAETALPSPQFTQRRIPPHRPQCLVVGDGPFEMHARIRENLREVKHRLQRRCYIARSTGIVPALGTAAIRVCAMDTAVPGFASAILITACSCRVSA